MEDNDNNKDDNDDKGISALGVDRDLDFSRGHKDNYYEEDYDEVEDHHKDDNNYKDDNNDKGISAPRLYNNSTCFTDNKITPTNSIFV